MIRLDLVSNLIRNERWKEKAVYLFAFVVAAVELLGSGFALDDGVDGFQVRWIGDDGQSDVLVGNAVETLDVRAQVIFHITRTL